MAFATEAQAIIMAKVLFPNDGFNYNSLIVWATTKLKMADARRAVGHAKKSEKVELVHIITQAGFKQR